MSFLHDFSPTSAGILIGVVTPWLTALVQQPQWTKSQRAVVAGVVAVVIGFVTAWSRGELGDGSDILATITAVIVASQATYHALWKYMGARRLEDATSPGSSRRARGDVADV